MNKQGVSLASWLCRLVAQLQMLPMSKQGVSLACWLCRLVAQLQMLPHMSASAHQALVAICNRMAARSSGEATVALGAGQQAQLEAEAAQELLPFAVRH